MEIKVENLTHIYEVENKKTRKEKNKKKDEVNIVNNEKKIGIENINVEIKSGDYVSLIGHTGSGKSTFIQHLNGLLKPNSGTITIGSQIVTSKTKKYMDLRKNVGMVFQYPEDQLFEETIEKDISYGPKNLGFSEEEIVELVKKSMIDVNLDYETFRKKAPYEISGGEKRKVAIASVLAMNPKVLILDEPTAGLDPQSKREILEAIKKIKEERNLTVIMVSHNMDDVFKYSNKLIVFNKGKIEIMGDTKEILSKKELLESIGLEIPFSMKVIEALNKSGFNIKSEPLSFEDLSKVIKDQLKND